MRTIRDTLKVHTNTIDITPMLESLRKRQYLNTLKELQRELSILTKLPTIDQKLKTKIKRSLLGVGQLLKNIQSSKN